jgi:hypothetical protein
MAESDLRRWRCVFTTQFHANFPLSQVQSDPGCRVRR